ncbi:MAG: XdhC family protein, partial [Gemmatimonadales bacterium]
MKHWQETREILRRLTEAVAAERAVAVATVVHIEGSAYRRPGAKLLIEASGTTVGGVSGGCLEADVRDVALGVMRDHAPSLCHYDTGSDENTVWGLGLGCDGKIDVFVQPVTLGAMDVWNSARELLDGNQPFALSTVVSGAEAGG